jgi:hypothetical protein
LLAGCSSDPADTPAQSEAPGGSSGQPGLDQAQQGMQQMMEGLQQMQQAQTTPVDYQVLEGFVPEFSGWERSEVTGQQVKSVVSVSNASATYTNGGASLELEITDTSLSQLLLAPFTMMTQVGYEEVSDEGYTRAITLAGYPGFEKWENAGGDAEVSLLVANRFIVRAEGSGLENTEPARQLVQAVDLATLATQE